jgi:hypothetical protein
METSNTKYDKKIKINEKNLKSEEIKKRKKEKVFQKQPLQNPTLIIKNSR